MSSASAPANAPVRPRDPPGPERIGTWVVLGTLFGGIGLAAGLLLVLSADYGAQMDRCSLGIRVPLDLRLPAALMAIPALLVGGVWGGTLGAVARGAAVLEGLDGGVTWRRSRVDPTLLFPAWLVVPALGWAALVLSRPAARVVGHCESEFMDLSETPRNHLTPAYTWHGGDPGVEVLASGWVDVELASMALFQYALFGAMASAALVFAGMLLQRAWTTRRDVAVLAIGPHGLDVDDVRHAWVDVLDVRVARRALAIERYDGTWIRVRLRGWELRFGAWFAETARERVRPGIEAQGREGVLALTAQREEQG